MNFISSGTWLITYSCVFFMLSHMIRFFAMVFSSTWFGLHSSIVLKLFGMEILFASSLQFDFRYMNERANKAAGAVMWRLTLLPSLMLEHLFSLTKFVLIMLCGGYISLPPSINRINLSSNCKSLKLSFVSFMPKQIIPSAHPAASEYPSRSKHFYALGFLPIWDSVISVMVRLQVPLWSSPMPISALVCTFIGISMSTVGGKSTGIWRIKVLERLSSDLAMLEALTPSKIAMLVNSLLGFKYW